MRTHSIVVAGVNTSVTVLSPSSPFIIRGSGETAAEPKSEVTLLTPRPDDEAASNIANVFTPPASISQLTSSTASVLLAAQEDSIPSNLEAPAAPEPKPKPDNASLDNFRGTLDLLDEIYSENLSPDNSIALPENGDGEDEEEGLNETENTGSNETSRPAVTPEPSEFTAAIESYDATVQRLIAPRVDYTASTVDISA